MAEIKEECEAIMEAATDLAKLRARPCLIVESPLDVAAVRLVRDALPEEGWELDMVIRSPGGCPCCAYAIARELKRRFAQVTVVVPLQAKSAATLVALVADDLVLGDLGELGPLDAQFSDRQKSDFPVERSRLELLAALDQMKRHAIDTFEAMLRPVVEKCGMRADNACKIGLEFASRIANPFYSRIDPFVLGQTMRSIETGAAYATRLLKRYRAELWERNGPQIVERLVLGYPDHGFVIDREELEELGVPVRRPTREEEPILDSIADSLLVRTEAEPLVKLVGVPEMTGKEETEDRAIDETFGPDHLAEPDP